MNVLHGPGEIDRAAAVDDQVDLGAQRTELRNLAQAARADRRALTHIGDAKISQQPSNLSGVVIRGRYGHYSAVGN